MKKMFILIILICLECLAFGAANRDHVAKTFAIANLSGAAFNIRIRTGSDENIHVIFPEDEHCIEKVNAEAFRLPNKSILLIYTSKIKNKTFRMRIWPSEYTPINDVDANNKPIITHQDNVANELYSYISRNFKTKVLKGSNKKGIAIIPSPTNDGQLTQRPLTQSDLKFITTKNMYTTSATPYVLLQDTNK